MDGNVREIKAFAPWHEDCCTEGVRRFAPPLVVVTALVLSPLLSGCGAPGDLLAELPGPALAVSANEHWQELRFIARAETSAPVTSAEVRVQASCDLTRTQALDGAPLEGQVRIMLAKDALEDDHGRGENVLPLEADAAVSVPRAAFETCTGACESMFLLVLAAEGIEDGVRVEVPVTIEATLRYEGEAPASDSVELELVDTP
jgi:hypothetical protein